VSAKQVPLLAIAAAFCFVIMMFNVPIPGGTTGHAVGSVLAAILLGPSAACVAMSVALVIQALLFGDGGITTLGANCFNMAFIMPISGYAVYILTSAGSKAVSLRRVLAAGIGGYIGIVCGALFAGIEFGLQPILHHTLAGTPLYCPYGFKIAISTMVGEHMLVFGWIEALVTAFVIRFLQQHDPLFIVHEQKNNSNHIKLLIGIGVLAVLSPLGIIIPKLFKAGSAWGEWAPEQVKTTLGFIPQGLNKLSSLFHAPLADYAMYGMKQSTTTLSIAYILSAGIGIILCVGVILILGNFLLQKKNRMMRKQTDAFIDKTIRGTVSILKETISTDAYAHKNGWLQKRDPRFKGLAALFLFAAILMTKSIPVLCGIYGLILLAALISTLGFSSFLKRTLLFVPIFSFCIVVPAMFNVVTPGATLVSFPFLPFDLSITKPGVFSASLVFLRVLCSVSLSILIILTTRQLVLLKMLRIFKIPALFVMTMNMCYRYIFLFLDIIQKMFLSVKSRVGFVSSTKTGQRIVTANMANLWLQSYRLHSQVFNAMQSRGYAGDVRILETFSATKQDYLLVLLTFLSLTGTLWINHCLH
jgi:cobalt/nickel transport system permease protein